MANIISDETIEYVGILAKLWREDVVTNDDERENIIKNAPGQKDGMFEVPKTFD